MGRTLHMGEFSRLREAVYGAVLAVLLILPTLAVAVPQARSSDGIVSINSGSGSSSGTKGRSSSSNGTRPAGISTRQNLIDYFNQIKGRHTISGQFIGCNDQPPNDFSAIIALNNETGKWPGLLGIDFYHYGAPGDAVLHAIPQAINYWQHGGLVILSTHMPNPTTHGGVADVSGLDGGGIVTSGTPTNIQFKRQLDQIGAGIKRLQGAGVIVIWRPFHENDGGWFWWGTGTGNLTVDQFKAMWIYTYNYMTHTLGLHNIVWAFTGTADLTNYPGDNYVDMVGVDTYTDDPSSGELPSRYAIFQSGAPSKPFALAEIGPHSPDTMDQTLWNAAIKSAAPNSVFWQSWWCGGGTWCMNDQSNVSVAVGDPWIINRGEISCTTGSCVP
jgi:mannan endo-1,4-beta-mannosidase